MGETKSTTKRDSTVIERIRGDHHHVTDIKSDDHEVRARGKTAEQAEKRASDKWDKKNRE
jgi:hypothetical protein